MDVFGTLEKLVEETAAGEVKWVANKEGQFAITMNEYSVMVHKNSTPAGFTISINIANTQTVENIASILEDNPNEQAISARLYKAASEGAS